MKIIKIKKEYIIEDVKVKLICINNTGHEAFLTKGKIYEGDYVDNRFYNVLNDRLGNKAVYSIHDGIFMTVDEYRGSKIDEILK